MHLNAIKASPPGHFCGALELRDEIGDLASFQRARDHEVLHASVRDGLPGGADRARGDRRRVAWLEAGV